VFGDGPPDTPPDQRETFETDAPDIERPPREEGGAEARNVTDDVERDFAELDELSLSTGSRPPVSDDDLD
jgi:hypothetical protein